MDFHKELTLIAETYTNGLMNFIRYLKGGIDPHDFVHLIEDFYESIGEDLPDSYDPDDPYDFFETEEFKKVKDRFLKKIESGAFGSGPDDPTYLFLTGAKLLPRDTWLIHFTDDPYDIARYGFQYGGEDYTRIGLTTHYTDKTRKSKPGWNFAFIAGSRDMDMAVKGGGRRGEPKYGRHAVLFQSAGVKSYHVGDQENQVVFWGPLVKDRYPIVWDGDENVWVVEGVDNKGQGRTLMSSEDIDDVIGWVEANHKQFGKMIKGEKKIQPTPKKDREKLQQTKPQSKFGSDKELYSGLS
jgi:hypothetical protein